MTEQRNACIVIPIYKDLSAWEQQALANNLEILHSHHATFIYPEGYDIGRLHGAYPHVELLAVSDEWLGKKHGIDGYNRMMLSEKFYGLFASYRYILICHTDAWIFRDEVAEWCARDYDLVAAPWPTRPIYRYLPFWLLKPFAYKSNPRSPFRRQDLCGHVGNGGLSLRKVETFRKACIDYRRAIEYYYGECDVYEDVFWAMVPKLSYPHEDEALRFAFDNKPAHLFGRNGKRLPMGCHGFQHPRRLKFWQKFIDIDFDTLTAR